MNPPVVPGPRGHALFGSVLAMREDPLAYMETCQRRYGRLVRVRMPWPIRAVYQVSCPELATQILVTDADRYAKSRVQRGLVEVVLGQGLFLAEGEAWKSQRRIVQPAFRRAKVASYIDTMVDCADAMATDWPAEGQREVLSDCVRFTLQVAARTLFGARLERDVARACAAMAAVDEALQRHLHSLLPLPLTVPTPTSLRVRAATWQLERIVADFVRQRRVDRSQRDDLLSRLLEERDAQGRPLTDRQLRDEAITAFVAGTETTALALAWTLHLLALHPAHAQQIRDEVATKLPRGRVDASTLAALHFTHQVVLEGMRLYPPFWHIAREAKCDLTLAGHHVPRGSLVLIMTYLMQRDATVFPAPSEFRPERWSKRDALMMSAFVPFGAGRRKCVGELLAVSELVAALATIVPRVELRPGASSPRTRPGASLRPRDGIHLRVTRRSLNRVEAAESSSGS
jgi:cytochrome P450